VTVAPVGSMIVGRSSTSSPLMDIRPCDVQMLHWHFR
jgi:hypothetical protein